MNFKKGEVISVFHKDEEAWLFARHSDGREVSIPVPYVQVVREGRGGRKGEGKRESEGMIEDERDERREGERKGRNEGVRVGERWREGGNKGEF